jgi:dienelactone hydrolase
MVYLVKPQGDGPFAGMIYMHWFGQGNSNRGQYLEEAVEMAKRGVVCLLPQGYFPWMTMPTGEPDWPLVIGQVQELRRAVDFLLSQPGVDPNRIGYAGHNYGAAYGGILAGVDHRVKAYVFVAGASRFGYWLTYFGYQIDFYGSAMEDLDPIQYLPNAAPANLFFQFPENDAFVPKEAADEFFNAASEPKKIEWYTDIQEMGSPAVRQAREEWLIEQLGLQ